MSPTSGAFLVSVLLLEFLTQQNEGLSSVSLKIALGRDTLVCDAAGVSLVAPPANGVPTHELRDSLSLWRSSGKAGPCGRPDRLHLLHVGVFTQLVILDIHACFVHVFMG